MILPFAIAIMPTLTLIAWIALTIAVVSALIILADIACGHHQHMAIMNLVWPLTALYAGPLALYAYFAFGRATRHPLQHDSMKHPMWQTSLLGATHCGAGCMVGDVITDASLFFAGATAMLGSTLFTSYVFDFIAAYLLGILFQYFAIAPMRHLSVRKGIWEAIKADTFSLIAFQIGMYAWMAIYQKLLFHPALEPNSAVYWLMMQIGMLAGLVTTYPMNWLLTKMGIKEAT